MFKLLVWLYVVGIMTGDSRGNPHFLSQFVWRPPSAVDQLPLRYRWEFTRRHPYYQMFWAIPQASRSTDAVQGSLVEIAELILAGVNVTGDTIPPATEWDDLSPDDTWSIWRQGAISRIQLKGLVAMLAVSLPKDALESVSVQLWGAAQLDDDDIQGKYNLFRSIAHGDFPGFEDYLPDLIVTIRPQATERNISSAISEIVREYREQHDIPSTRTRVDRFDDYLRAWDLREGWHAGAYYKDRERTLEAVAAQARRPRSTVMDHYRSAFQLITGVEYSPEVWLQIVGRFKLAGYLGCGYDTISRRGGRTRSIAGDPASGFSSESNFMATCFPSREIDPAEQAMTTEFLDALQSGTSIPDLIRQFDLDPVAAQAIQQLRDHLNDVR